MLINNSESYSVSSVYFDRSFRIVLEDHLGILKASIETIMISVKPLEALKYEGDFSGLLTSYNVPVNLHWITMRMNDLTSPSDSPDDLEFIIVPNQTFVERLRSGYMTENKIKA